MAGSSTEWTAAPRKGHKASLNGEFHHPGFQDVKLWYEIDVSLNA
jgi:hypothetical protein